MTGLDALRQQSARMARGMGVLVAALAVLLVLERFGWLAVAGSTGSALWQRLALAAVAAVPDALYLAALWWVRRALVELAQGRLFARVVSQALRRVGLLMLASAVLIVFVLPSVFTALGQPPGYRIAYDMSQMASGAVGLALGLVSRLLQQAAAIQSELDEIF